MVKLKRVEAASGQSEMFDSLADLAPDDTEEYLAAELERAKLALVEATPLSPATTTFGVLWPRVLGRYVVRKTQLNQIASELKSAGVVEFLDWGPKKRVPDDSYRMTRRR
ncbi:hypothetical protein [Phenylobacterium aquaticum]|uniref:hypothetical protein n=1 Tax=Phenylobacterium aquaticum TaxID=1763816 RepID=UPI0026F312BA|nr:hypothetical protein [Phenylobacterium aquaticum]